MSDQPARPSPATSVRATDAASDHELEQLAHLRHALRTPLNQIIGYAEILIESAQEKKHPGLLRDLKKIHNAGGQILAVLNDTLALWKIACGKFDLRKMRHQLIPPLNTILSGSALAEADRARARIPGLSDDLAKIHQAARNFYNLIEGATVLPKPTRPAPRELPPRALRSATMEKNRSAKKSPKSHTRVLIVDDDALSREMLVRRLQHMGYATRQAETGHQALDELKQRPFDLVLLDIMMPALDGYATLAHIKNDPTLRHLPVIMLTALAGVESTARCLEAGAEDYIPKPFNAVILRARITATLEKKRLRDQEQAALQQLRSERAKSDQLLLNVLPQAIADRLKQGEHTIVDSFLECTVLFADIVNFSQIVNEHTPNRTVQLLNDLFSTFDRIAENQRLEKIKTIGDSYMLVGGVPTPRSDHASACAQAALDMLDDLRAFNRRHDLHWSVRIGLNSGPVIGGIIGTKKFAYDLWGDTVNLASRMESQGQPGRIQLTTTTRALLDDKFQTEVGGIIDIKHTGPMQVFHLVAPTAA